MGLECDMCHRAADVDGGRVHPSGVGAFCSAECAVGFTVHILGRSAAALLIAFGRRVEPMPRHVFYELSPPDGGPDLTLAQKLAALRATVGYTGTSADDAARYEQHGRRT